MGSSKWTPIFGLLKRFCFQHLRPRACSGLVPTRWRAWLRVAKARQEFEYPANGAIRLLAFANGKLIVSRRTPPHETTATSSAVRRESAMSATTQLDRIDDFQKLPAVLASSPPSQNLKFEREDWSLFRTVEGLQQKAGVAKHKLFRLVLKELIDNGLDEGAEVRIGPLPDGGYFVEDDGRGIDGAPEEIAQLFSIARPMIST
jgi:hypothetical protein